MKSDRRNYIVGDIPHDAKTQSNRLHGIAFPQVREMSMSRIILILVTFSQTKPQK